MEPENMDELVRDWVELQRLDRDAPERESKVWTIDALDELQQRAPELLWEFILMVLDRESDGEILGMVAAWPLENLLSDHGDAFIDRVEELASSSKEFRRVLTGLYRGGMSDEVWSRAQVASQRPQGSP
jgi:hypothetical protein